MHIVEEWTGLGRMELSFLIVQQTEFSSTEAGKNCIQVEKCVLGRGMNQGKYESLGELKSNDLRVES